MHLVPSADADNASGTFLRRSLDGSGVGRSSFDAVWSETSVLLIFCELLNEPKDLDGLEPEGVSAGPWIDATRLSAYFAYSYGEDVGPSSVAFVLYSVPIMNSRSTFDSSAARILIVEPLWIYRSFAAHSPDIYMMFENASVTYMQSFYVESGQLSLAKHLPGVIDVPIFSCDQASNHGSARVLSNDGIKWLDVFRVVPTFEHLFRLV